MANLSSAPVLLEVTSRTPAILSTSFSRRRIPVKRVANSCWPNTPPPPLNFPFLSPFPLSLSLPPPCSYFRYFDFKKKKEIKRFRALCNRKVIVREDRVCIIETCTRRTEVGRMDVRESRSRWWKSTRGEDVFSLSFFPPLFFFFFFFIFEWKKRGGGGGGGLEDRPEKKKGGRLSCGWREVREI